MNLAIQQADMFPDKGQLKHAVDVLTARFVWFYPKLTHLLGSPKSALLMCALMDGARTIGNKDGWVYKTREIWALETGLGRREQESAREQLKSLGFLHEYSSGSPRRLYLKANLEQLGAALAARAGLSAIFKAWDWNNSAMMLQLLGKPFGFYQQAASVCGSAQASIYLSFLIFLQRGAMNNAAHTAEWFTLPAQRAEALLGLTYRMQQTARSKLLGARLIDERPAPSLSRETQVRVRFSALLDLLKRDATHTTKYPRQKNKISVDNSLSVDNVGKNEYLCLREPKFGFLKTTKTPYGTRQKRPNENDKNALIDTTKTPHAQVHFVGPYIKTKEKQLPLQSESTKTPHVPMTDSGGGCGGELTLDAIPEIWRTAVQAVLAGLDHQAGQELADEFAARMNATSMTPLHAPLRYLDRLIDAHRRGQFRAEMGLVIAQQRESRAKTARLIDAAKQGSKPTKAPDESSQNASGQSEAALAARAKLMSLKAAYQINRHGNLPSQADGGGVVKPHPPGKGNRTDAPLPLLKGRAQQDQVSEAAAEQLAQADGRGLAQPTPSGKGNRTDALLPLLKGRAQQDQVSEAAAEQLALVDGGGLAQPTPPRKGSKDVSKQFKFWG